MNDIEKLLQITGNMKYPDSMICVDGKIKGKAFFPGGSGLLCGTKNIADKNIMVLGQDFDCELNYKKSLEKDGEQNPTWNNLEKLFIEAGIDYKDVFYTNAIMGVRNGNKGTGKSPAFKDNEFIKECINFFLTQVKLQKPKLILALGIIVSHFLSKVNTHLAGWKGMKSFNELDNKGLQVMKDVDFGDFKTTIILLIHPSFRPVNIRRRSYKNLKGNDAELKMIRDHKNF